jgi:hypothetical protein
MSRRPAEELFDAHFASLFSPEERRVIERWEREAHFQRENAYLAALTWTPRELELFYDRVAGILGRLRRFNAQRERA